MGYVSGRTWWNIAHFQPFFLFEIRRKFMVFQKHFLVKMISEQCSINWYKLKNKLSVFWKGFFLGIHATYGQKYLRESDRLAWLVDCEAVDVTWSQSLESLWELIRFISITSVDLDSSSWISLILMAFSQPVVIFSNLINVMETNRFLSRGRIKSWRSYRSRPHQWVRCRPLNIQLSDRLLILVVLQNR